MVIGVSDEEYDLIDKYVADKGVEFPVARLASGAFEEAIGVKGFPTSAIIDPSGEIVWSGHPAQADGPLGSHVKRSKRTPLLPASLSHVEKLLDKEDYAAAYRELKQLRDELAQEDAADADALIGYIESQAERLWTKGAGYEEHGDYYTAYLAYSELADRFEGVGRFEEARAKVEAFEADDEIARELKGGAHFAKALEQEEKGDFDKAYKTYKTIASRYKGLRVAGRAAVRMSELKGFDKNCSSCRQGNKACPRHAGG